MSFVTFNSFYISYAILSINITIQNIVCLFCIIRISILSIYISVLDFCWFLLIGKSNTGLSKRIAIKITDLHKQKKMTNVTTLHSSFSFCLL